MIPQIIIIGLSMMSLGIHIVKHGEPQDHKYNLFHKIIAIFISYTILHYGGFWDVLLK